MGGELERARDHYAARRWADAFEAFLTAERQAPLDAEDLDRLVWCAALVADEEAFVVGLERLYRVSIETARMQRAVRACFWAGLRLLALGESARGMGWLARAERHLAQAPEVCAERGYLMLPTVYRHLGSGDSAAAEKTAREAASMGERCDEADLVALARSLEGRAALQQRKMQEGTALLDEVMLTVTSGELSPLVTGLVYCNVIGTCQEMFAVDRARQWTAALARWCEAQPQLVTFTGYCLVHRSEILQMGGQWPQALDEVTRVCDRSRSHADPEVLGDASYQRAEILRLRGQHSEAEAAYRLASDHGRDPQPGLALLRLAEGRGEEAMKAMERVVATMTSPWQRARVLPAYVEVAISVGELEKASAASEELSEIARSFGTEVLGAMAAHARGAVQLSAGRPEEAIEALRRALGAWNKVGAPYIAARIRVSLARAYEAVGDRDGAELERTGATEVFTALGAIPDLDALEGPRKARRGSRGELSPRELQVLRLVARGMSNKSIARKLVVSERTVDRHVSNIFKKIDVSSRAAATAYAYQHHLL